MRFVLTLVVVSAVAAFAQNASTTVREADVRVTGARLAFLPDGGCTVQPELEVVAPSPKLRVEPAPRAFNGTRCSTARNAVTRAANLDVSAAAGATVGDGSQP